VTKGNVIVAGAVPRKGRLFPVNMPLVLGLVILTLALLGASVPIRETPPVVGC
jgi:hypothetical protein